MYDIFSNNKISLLRNSAQQTPGTATQLEVNMQDKNAVVGNYERSNRALIILDVTAVASNGTLDITIEDYLFNSKGVAGEWDVDFATIPQITEAGLYAFEIRNFGSKLRLSGKCTTANITWNAILIGFEATRRPVEQADATVLTATYATDRLQPLTSAAIADVAL
jgi:hypothetical protein